MYLMPQNSNSQGQSSEYNVRSDLMNLQRLSSREIEERALYKKNKLNTTKAAQNAGHIPFSIELKQLLSFEGLIILAKNYLTIDAAVEATHFSYESFIDILTTLKLSFNELINLPPTTINKIENLYIQYGKDFNQQFLQANLHGLLEIISGQKAFTLHNSFYLLIYVIAQSHDFTQVASKVKVSTDFIMNIIHSEFLPYLMEKYPFNSQIAKFEDLKNVCTFIVETHGFENLLCFEAEQRGQSIHESVASEAVESIIRQAKRAIESESSKLPRPKRTASIIDLTQDEPEKINEMPVSISSSQFSFLANTSLETDTATESKQDDLDNLYVEFSDLLDESLDELAGFI